MILDVSLTSFHRISPKLSFHSEWIQNQHRDTLASTIGHPHMLHTLAVAQNKSVARVRYEALQKMIQPVGKSPLEQQK